MKVLKDSIHCLPKKIVTWFFLIALTTSPVISFEKAEKFLSLGKIQEAIDTLMPMVEKEQPQALYLMAMIHLLRDSSYYNLTKGLFFLEKAVHQNHAPALEEMAGLCLEGEGVEKNEAKALYYYEQAAYLGYGPSQFNCGILYKEGQGTEKNLIKAYVYLSLAALNSKDLEELTLDAARYRDEVALFLSSSERQEALRQINALTSF